MFSGALKTVAAAGATATAVAGAAIGKIVKDSVDAYANYEQLVGGVETLFGDSAQRVLQDAQAAFKTAGMSMNDYMETSIQSAAAMINSLDGDQEKAAKLMNMSIVDMADNVNKMGTTMEAVQNAYRGFSRGNFTMLDNLALGFAGTKEGMQQLLDKAQELSGIEYDISSYSDIVQAIHVVQTEMKISGISAQEAAKLVAEGVLTEEEALEKMGTTAKEAATTIQGSLGATKAAWQNLITGLSDKNADVSGLVENLIWSAELFAKNVIPVIKQALSGVGTAITQIAPEIGTTLMGIITDVLPDLLKSAIATVKEIGRSIKDNANDIISAVFEIIDIIVQTVANPETVAKFINATVKIVEELTAKLSDNLPTLITTVYKIMTSVLTELTSGKNLETMTNAAFWIIESLTDGLLSSIDLLVNAALKITSNLAESLINDAPRLLGAAVEMIQKLADSLVENIPILIPAVVNVIMGIINTLTDPGNLNKVLQSAINIVLAVVDGIMRALPEVLTAAPEIIVNLIMGLVGALGQIWAFAPQIVLTLIDGIASMFSDLVDNGDEIIQQIGDGIKKKIEDAKTWGKDLIDNFVGGILKTWENLKQKVANIAGWFKGIFGHSHPTIGPMKDDYKWMPDMMDLFTKGIEDNAAKLQNAAQSAFDLSDAMTPPDAKPVSLIASDNYGNEDESITFETNGDKKMDRVIELLTQYLPTLSAMKVYLDSGVLVGEIAPGMDAALGRRAVLAGRGTI